MSPADILSNTFTLGYTKYKLYTVNNNLLKVLSIIQRIFIPMSLPVPHDPLVTTTKSV